MSSFRSNMFDEFERDMQRDIKIREFQMILNLHHRKVNQISGNGQEDLFLYTGRSDFKSDRKNKSIDRVLKESKYAHKQNELSPMREISTHRKKDIFDNRGYQLPSRPIQSKYVDNLSPSKPARNINRNSQYHYQPESYVMYEPPKRPKVYSPQKKKQIEYLKSKEYRLYLQQLANTVTNEKDLVRKIKEVRNNDVYVDGFCERHPVQLPRNPKQKHQKKIVEDEQESKENIDLNHLNQFDQPQQQQQEIPTVKKSKVSNLIKKQPPNIIKKEQIVYKSPISKNPYIEEDTVFQEEEIISAKKVGKNKKQLTIQIESCKNQIKEVDQEDEKSSQTIIENITEKKQHKQIILSPKKQKPPIESKTKLSYKMNIDNSISFKKSSIDNEQFNSNNIDPYSKSYKISLPAQKSIRNCPPEPQTFKNNSYRPPASSNSSKSPLKSYRPNTSSTLSGHSRPSDRFPSPRWQKQYQPSQSNRIPVPVIYHVAPPQASDRNRIFKPQPQKSMSSRSVSPSMSKNDKSKGKKYLQVVSKASQQKYGLKSFKH